MSERGPATARTERQRPGGRSARVRAAVLAATLEVLSEGGFDAVELPEVARRAGVHPATVYRGWKSRDRLVGSALLEQGRRPLRPTPDTGTLRTDLQQLLIDGGELVRTPAVRALFAVLLGAASDPSPQVVHARDAFIASHIEEIQAIVDRATARGELAPGTDPRVVMEQVIGPALVRTLLLGAELGAPEAAAIADRALLALDSRGPTWAGRAGSGHGAR